MLIISRRECRLGEKYSGKKQKEGEARTIKLELTGIALDGQELGSVLQEPHAYQALYNTGSDPIEPILRGIKALEFKGAWAGAHVVLHYALGAKSVELKAAKLSRIRIEPSRGGDTKLSLVLEGEPPLDRKLVDLIERTGESIEVELRADHPEAQRDLPLNQHGEGEQAEASGSSTPKRQKPYANRGPGKRRRGNGNRPSAN